MPTVSILESLDLIIEAAGGLLNGGNAVDLANDLKKVARRFDIMRADAEFLSVHSQLDQLAKLKAAAERLLKLLKAVARSEAEERPKAQWLLVAIAPNLRDREMLAALTSDLERLLLLVEAARRRRSTPSGDSLIIDLTADASPEGWLIGRALPEIYERHFGRRFGISKPHRSKGNPSGPGVKFILASLECLGIKKTSSAVAKMYERFRDKAPQM